MLYSPREGWLSREGRIPLARQRLAGARQRSDDRRDFADRLSCRCVCGRAGNSQDLPHSRDDPRRLGNMQLRKPQSAAHTSMTLRHLPWLAQVAGGRSHHSDEERHLRTVSAVAGLLG